MRTCVVSRHGRQAPNMMSTEIAIDVIGSAIVQPLARIRAPASSAATDPAASACAAAARRLRLWAPPREKIQAERRFTPSPTAATVNIVTAWMGCLGRTRLDSDDRLGP